MTSTPAGEDLATIAHDARSGSAAAAYHRRMGVRRWFYDLLSRGDAPELDPEEHIEARVVHETTAPMTIALLERNGIGAVSMAVPRVPGARLADYASIRVRRCDVDEARRLIDEHG